ncbi:flagellar hook-length control protein FliK [Mesorhizobium sp. IMUNJ 23232]|uniref:flagellar hook-length control protein FliK n=1 Tax=Mesorhizobium sp. IMUNJ 23232 TaxID=3376064 RepID=UPI00379C048E
MKTTDITNPGLLPPKHAKHALRGAGHPSDGAFSKLVRPIEPAATARAARGERIDASARHIAARDHQADATQPETWFVGHLERGTGQEVHHDRPAPTYERAGKDSEVIAPDDHPRRKGESDASDADTMQSTGTPAAAVTTPDLPELPRRHNGAKRSADMPAEAKPDLPRVTTGSSNILDGKHEDPGAGAAAPPIDVARSPTANAPVENRLKPTFAADAERPSHHDADRHPAPAGPAAKSSSIVVTPIPAEPVKTRQAHAELAPAETHLTQAPTGSSQPIPDHHANQRAPSPDKATNSAARSPATAANAPVATAFTSDPLAIAQPDRTAVQTEASSASPSLVSLRLPGPAESPTEGEPAQTETVISSTPRADDLTTRGTEAPARPPPAPSARPVSALNEPISAGLEPQTASTDIDSEGAADMPNPDPPAGPALPTAMAAAASITTAGKEAPPILFAAKTSSDATDLPAYRPAAAQIPANTVAQIVSARSEPVAAPTAMAQDEPVRLAPPTSVQPTLSIASASVEESAIPAQTARPMQPGATATASDLPDPGVGTPPPSFAVELTAAAARYVNRQSARAEDTSPAARAFDGPAATPTEPPDEARIFAPREPPRAPLPAMMWRTLSPAPATATPDMERQASPDQALEPPVSDTVPTTKDDDAEIDAKGPPEPGRSTQPSVVTGPLKSVETATQPASPPLAVAAAILSEPTWRATPVAQTTQSQSVRTQPVLKSLQVQLNPEHLGVVIATLSMSGTQLTVELSVATREAHDRLKGEEQVIEKAVRSLGYDVGQISIIQSLIVQNMLPRTDATMPQPMAQGRDQPNGGMGSGDGGNRSGSQQGGRHDGNASGAFGGTASRDADRRGGVYI